MFASHLVEDLRLPHIPFYKEVATQIRRQLEDARVTAAYDAHLALSLDPVREANRSWFENRAKRRRLGTEGTSEGLVQDAEDEELAPASSLDDVTTDELRVVIRVRTGALRDRRADLAQLDITLESVQLVDRFEWDMSDPTNSPEAFAEVFAADLGLAGEFRCVKPLLERYLTRAEGLRSRTRSGNRWTSLCARCTYLDTSAACT